MCCGTDAKQRLRIICVFTVPGRILITVLYYDFVRLLEHLSTLGPNTGSGGLDSVSVALVMAALQALHCPGADSDHMELPLISGKPLP